ncbi:carbohydrate esterase family 5 protein [Sclerotinia borealis F-4128]|uniref:Cutinase n=1 Tax=Sclerotinia borealis (strain F-4128) TaxID=1432307 RepID=W9CRF7_SCLBF|nr:carbohydrate esterase family 5 protein [Sclerotinia borealis F-4128]
MTVLFARGTGEPGNVGILTGPPFFVALAAYMNETRSMSIQGVDYAATTSGFLAGGDPAGAKTMADLINNTLSTCPSTHLTVSGYSQGAQLVHLAMSSLSNTTTSRIKTVVMFGDPKNGTALNGVDASKVMTICDPKDDICKGGDAVLPAHLEYSANAGTAAMFALSGLADVGITSARKISGVDGIVS